jgi:hypothetical protein
VAFTNAGKAPLLVGWVKLKRKGGWAALVDVEVVTVLPLVLVVHTPLLGVTVWAEAGRSIPLAISINHPRRMTEG